MKQVTIEVVYLPTGECKTFGGFMTLKEVYQRLKQYEKDERFELYAVNFAVDADLFSSNAK